MLCQNLLPEAELRIWVWLFDLAVLSEKKVQIAARVRGRTRNGTRVFHSPFREVWKLVE